MESTIGLLGNGSQADEVESFLVGQSKVAFRAVSGQYLDSESPAHLIDIAAPGDNLKTSIIAAVGAPAIRKKMVGLWRGNRYSTLISDAAIVNKRASIGPGTVIAPGAVVTTNVTIGEHVLINIGATISHDCHIGNFVTISPGVHIAGNVKIGDGTFIGIGAVISNHINIAPGTVIGAGAAILADVPIENSVVVGVPGKVIKRNEGWLNEL
jgi:sugar O-acyltransferase (sialic acid O-acetyltransferase NeuD family)